MDLEQLEAVLAVVDHGTFTAAASALYLTQPSLSRRIAGIEGELGIALFDRVGRQVRLTDAGTALLAPARRALSEIRNVRAALEAVQGMATGSLRVAGLPSLVVSHLAPLIGPFHGGFPGILLSIDSAPDTQTLVSMVESAECDVAVVDLPVSSTELRTIRLGHQDFLVVLPPGTLPPPVAKDRALPTIGPRQLREHTLVTVPTGTSIRTTTDQVYADAGVVPSRVIVTSQRSALVPLVLGGAGLTMLPDYFAHEATAGGGVVARPSTLSRRTVGLVHRSDSVSPALDAFIALAAASSRRS